MLQKLGKRDKGFTIIEVMIVLAIGGLILLIVFLAVPALQRNSRNTSRKNDVAALLAGVTEYTANKNGALPTAYSDFSNEVKLGYYNTAGTSVTFTPNPTSDIGTGPTNVDTVQMYNNMRCQNDADGGAQRGGASARNIVALFATENASGGAAQAQCQEG